MGARPRKWPLLAHGPVEATTAQVEIEQAAEAFGLFRRLERIGVEFREVAGMTPLDSLADFVLASPVRVSSMDLVALAHGAPPCLDGFGGI